VIYDLVGKVVVTSGDYTEYTTLQYLAGREPKIPAPKPHGLIRTGGICIIFGSYILSMMLTKAWPMRTLQRDDYYFECVERKRIEDHTDRSIISVLPGSEHLDHITPYHGSRTYCQILHSFFTYPVNVSVFAHGGCRTDIIIMNRGQNNACVVTGIIDWEDRRIYPKHYECTS
jgi:hypothetical protein